MHKYNSVIFDFDGVLVNSEPVYFTVWQELIGGEYVFTPADLIGKSDKQFLESIAYKLDSTHIVTEKNQRVISAISNKAVENELKDLLFLLKAKGYNIGIASNNNETVIIDWLESNTLKHLFSIVASSKLGFPPKPSPEIFEYVHRAFGETACSLVVEDSDIGIQAAKNGGFEVVKFGYDCFDESIGELKAKLIEI